MNISVLVKRYLMAAIIVVVGLAMIIVGFRTNQDGLFMMAAVNLLIGGVLALLFSAGILGRNIVMGIGAVAVIATIFIGNSAIKSVERTIQHDKDYVRSARMNQYVLSQIRDIQRAYRTEKGVYAATFDELKDFFENDKITKVDASGAVPSRKLTIQERDALYTDKRALDQNMTEREAALLVALGNPTNSSDLATFKRDTIEVYFKDEFISSKTRHNMREQAGYTGKFNVEELRYIPMTDPKEEWTFETRDAVPYLNEDTIATVYIHGLEAVSRFEDGKRNEIGFGNLNTNSDKGTWE